jgi:hypothetical protein
MLKRAATQNTMKELNEKLLQRLTASVEEVDKLMSQTNVPQYTAVPDPNVLNNLLAECEDSEFWHNFKKAAPILFCSSIEHD